MSLFIQKTGSASEVSTGRTAAREQAITFLNDLVGLDEVKGALNKMLAFASLLAERKKRELRVDPQALHMLFVGPPGTGKTEVARQVGKLLYSCGLLRRGHVVEAAKQDLVGQYIGETPKKVEDKFKEAMGGVLFVDEAYTLADGQYGKEACDCILKLMEDFREDVVVIFAGYEHNIEKLLDTNPGFRSRFTRRMRFTNYQPADLIRIFNGLMHKGGFKLEDAAQREAERYIAEIARKGERDPNFGNARAIRSLYENIVSAQSERLANRCLDDADALSKMSNEELLTIARGDVEVVSNA